MQIHVQYYKYHGISEDLFRFSVYTAQGENPSSRVCCYGMVPVLPKLTPLILDGEYEDGSFIVTSYRLDTDISKFRDCMCTYTGIGKRRVAKAISGVFTRENPWHFDDDDFAALMSLGYSDEEVSFIRIFITGINNDIAVFHLLRSFHWGAVQIDRFRKYKHTVNDLEERPYLTGYACGATLNMCDMAADYINQKNHLLCSSYTPYSHERIEVVLKMSSDIVEKSGHVYVTPDELSECLRILLCNDMEESPFYVQDTDLFLLHALHDEVFHVEEEQGQIHLYLPRYRAMEKDVAENLKRLTSVRMKAIFYNETGTKYDVGQVNAISGCLDEYPVCILTGGPGTGKTTVTREIVRLFRKNGLRVGLCSPTGRAAARIKESTGYMASTIHRMIGVSVTGGEEYTASYNDSKPLSYDVIIMDESSMVGLDIFAMFLHAVKTGCKLILIGDDNQLPSVTPGNVLQDMIESGVFPVFRLSHIYRQQEGSSIVSNAYHIMKKEAMQTDKDFEIRDFANEEGATKYIINTFLQEYDTSNPYSFQILCPTKIGAMGTRSLNDSIIDSLPGRVKKGYSRYAIGDKIMSVRNNYDDLFQYMNGDIGIVKRVSEEMLEITNGLGKNMYVKDLNDLQHAYASTIHKSQGSEYDVVMIVLGRSGGRMMNRKLLYTAVTRAKKKVIIVNIAGALAMTQSSPAPRRQSGLKTLLQDA